MVTADELCARCLVQVSPAALMVAEWHDADGLLFKEACQTPTRPQGIVKWVGSVIRKDPDAIFSIDQNNHMLVPFATWHGDPICVVHLVEVRCREAGWRHGM